MSYQILIVEDDPSIQELLEEFLSMEGYQCVCVTDGAEAQKLIVNRHFDLMITDFRMPNLNGVELIKWCRKNEYRFPVIFLTATEKLLPYEMEALTHARTYMVKKPLNVSDLLSLIERTRGHEELPVY